MALVTSGLLAAGTLAASAGGTLVSGASARNTAKMNSQLATMEGEAGKKQAEHQARQMGKTHRDMKATQRVAVATSGAGIGQDQTLALLADESNKMKLDQIEMRRRGVVSKSKARMRSLFYDAKADNATLSTGAGLLSDAFRMANVISEGSYAPAKAGV